MPITTPIPKDYQVRGNVAVHPHHQYGQQRQHHHCQRHVHGQLSSLHQPLVKQEQQKECAG
jgi:hypothetical protein